MRDFVKVIGDNVAKYGKGLESAYGAILNNYRIYIAKHTLDRTIYIHNSEQHIEVCYKLYEAEYDYLKEIFETRYKRSKSEFLNFIQSGGLIAHITPESGVVEDTDMYDEPVKD